MDAPSPEPPIRLGSLFRRLGPVGPVAIISMTLPGVMGLLLVWASVKYHHLVAPWVQENFLLAVAFYVVGFAILAGLPILPTYSVSFLGGYLFKFGWGVGASLGGYMGAAMVSYLFLHMLSGDRVEKIIDEHAKWKAVRDELLGRSAWRTMMIVALLRLPPNLPFAVVNLVLVTAKIRPSLYFAGTLLGVIPRTLAVVYIAAAASKLEYDSGSKWMTIGGIAITVVVLMIITHLSHKAIRRLTDAHARAQ